VMAIVKECGCVCNQGDGAATMVHKSHTANRTTEKRKEVSK